MKAARFSAIMFVAVLAWVVAYKGRWPDALYLSLGVVVFTADAVIDAIREKK